MISFRRLLPLAVIAIAPLLSACESFDMDKLDVFGINEKKKIPGERRPVFPEGVPGVTQGVPPEYIKGSQEAAAAAGADTQEAAVAPAEPAPQAAPAAEAPKPKPRAVTRTPSQVRAQQRQAAQPAAAPAPSTAPWPDAPQQQTQQPAATAPWPSSPPTDTFTR